MLIDDAFSRSRDLNQDRPCLSRCSLRFLHLDDYVQVQQMCLAGDAGQPRLTFHKRYGLRIIGSHFHAYSVRELLQHLVVVCRMLSLFTPWCGLRSACCKGFGRVYAMMSRDITPHYEQPRDRSCFMPHSHPSLVSR